MKRLSLPINKLRNLYLEGWTITKLAQKYYCSYYAMWSRLQEMGVVRGKKHIFISPSELKNTYEIQGLGLKKIADGYGVSMRTVIRKKKRAWNDIEKIRNGKTGKFTPILIHYLRFEKKMKIREVAEITGLNQRTVCRLQKKDIEELRKQFVIPKETL